MSKNQLTGTATQPQRNRKFCQFNKDQYCIYIRETGAKTRYNTEATCPRDTQIQFPLLDTRQQYESQTCPCNKY